MGGIWRILIRWASEFFLQWECLRFRGVLRSDIRVKAKVLWLLLLVGLVIGCGEVAEVPVPETAVREAVVLRLPCRLHEHERVWSDALAARWKGAREVRVAHGRADVVSEGWAVEVDRLGNWHEGLGQAAHYGYALGKEPVLALIVPELPVGEHRALIENAAGKSGVRVVWLLPGE